jgi:hypothetical protein
MHARSGGARGFSDFNTLDVAGGTRRSFLNYARAEGEGLHVVWLDGADQLLRYLRMQHGSSRGISAPPMGSSRSEEWCASSSIIERQIKSGVAIQAMDWRHVTEARSSIRSSRRLPGS